MNIIVIVIMNVIIIVIMNIIIIVIVNILQVVVRLVIYSDQQLMKEWEMAKSEVVILKGGYCKIFFSFIGPVGYNIWWENSRNGSFGPKTGPKMPKIAQISYFCIF